MTAAPDKGAAVTLFDDYHCPAAPAMVHNADGTWTATDARKLRIDCALTGAQAELNEWRPKKDAATQPPSGFQIQVSHGVMSLAVAAITTYLAVVKSRADRNCRAVLDPFHSC